MITSTFHTVRNLWHLPACRCTMLLIPLLASALFTPWKPVQLLALGMFLGATLYIFHFGFTRVYAGLISEHRTLGPRALLVLLAFGSVLFFPLLAQSDTLNGFYRPLSLGLLIGSAIFGVGMALSSTCTSGTLNRLGQLNPLSPVVLIGLVIGGILAAWHFETWQHAPTFAPVNLLQLGWPLALGLQLLAITALYYWALQWERRHHGHLEPLSIHPWFWAVILLAIGNLLTLLTLQQPWSIATVFPYWGLMLNDALNGPIEDWRFWAYTAQMAALYDQSPWEAPVSVMAIGLILGSLLSAQLTRLTQEGNKRPQTNIKVKVQVRSFIGGILMGYGAIIAYGCNIGALFSGTISGSLHGWIWFAASLAGYALVVSWQGLKKDPEK